MDSLLAHTDEHPPSLWVEPYSGLLQERWDPAAHVAGLKGQSHWLSLAELHVPLREGARSATPEGCDGTLYRPSSILDIDLHDEELDAIAQPTSGAPSPSSPLSPRSVNAAPVGPGDVVLAKFLPLQAAWVSPSTPRRSIDANCIRMVGLPRELGFWIAFVLSHPTYGAQLPQSSGRAASVPRIGLRDLRSLCFPEPPPGLAALVDSWVAAGARAATARAKTRDLQAEVDAFVATEAPTPPHPVRPARRPAAAIRDSWLPAHAALHHYQARARRLGWRPLEGNLPAASERLRGRPARPLRVLRLRDARPPFGFALPELALLAHPSFRILADPLQPAEVLLSLLGSSPRVVFHHPPVSDTTVWLADHWARLRPAGPAASPAQSLPPGALALVLRSPAVACQLALAATGAARQFVPRRDLARLHIPAAPGATALRWHEQLCDALEQLSQSAAERASVRQRVDALVLQCLGARR